ncbi:hypothetical protein HK101_006730, partial [Irineochytrium annulatum]
ISAPAPPLTEPTIKTSGRLPRHIREQPPPLPYPEFPARLIGVKSSGPLQPTHNLNKMRFMAGWEKIHLLSQFQAGNLLPETVLTYRHLIQNAVIRPRLPYLLHHNALHMFIAEPVLLRDDLLRLWRIGFGAGKLRAGHQAALLPGRTNATATAVTQAPLSQAELAVQKTQNLSVETCVPTVGVVEVMCGLSCKWGDRDLARELVDQVIIPQALKPDRDAVNALLQCLVSDVKVLEKMSDEERSRRRRAAIMRRRGWAEDDDKADVDKDVEEEEREMFKAVEPDIDEEAWQPRWVGPVAASKADLECAKRLWDFARGGSHRDLIPSVQTYVRGMELHGRLGEAEKVIAIYEGAVNDLPQIMFDIEKVAPQRRPRPLALKALPTGRLVAGDIRGGGMATSLTPEGIKKRTLLTFGNAAMAAFLSCGRPDLS